MRIIGRFLYWVAQGALPLGAPGARLAHYLLTWALMFDPGLDRARGWQYLIAGSFARARGEAEEAVGFLKEASVLLPDSDVVIANLGITLTAAGRHEEAIETIERALRGETDLSEEAGAWVALVWSYLRTGRAPKALQSCDRAGDARVHSPDLELLRALAQAEARGSFSRADLGRMVRSRVRMLPVVLEYVVYLARKGSQGLARDITGCLPSRLQGRAYSIIARSALNEEDLDTALWALGELEAREPGEVSVALMRSEVSMRRHQLDAAIRHAREAVTVAGRDPAAWEQLARVQLLRGEWEPAVLAAQESVSRGGRGALAGGMLALSLLERGMAGEARRLFLRQRSGDRLACVYAHAAQALIHACGREPEAALRVLRREIEGLRALPDWACGEAALVRPVRAVQEALERVSQSHVAEARALERDLEQALRRATRTRPPQGAKP